eukprot:2787294-Rhodomonas_salina.1
MSSHAACMRPRSDSLLHVSDSLSRIEARHSFVHNSTAVLGQRGPRSKARVQHQTLQRRLRNRMRSPPLKAPSEYIGL